jgi:hypothetical protein
MSDFKAYVLKYLEGEAPQSIRDISIALDLHNQMPELRACLQGLRRHNKIFEGAFADGIKRYSLKPFMPPAPPSAAAPSVDAAKSVGRPAPEALVALTIADKVLSLMARVRQPATVRDLVHESRGDLIAIQITTALQQLKEKGRVVLTGSRAGSRWSSVETPGPQGATDSNTSAAAGAVVASPEPLSPATSESSAIPLAGDPTLSRTLSRLPLRLLARIESIAVDIEDVTGEAIDAGLEPSGLKSLVAAGGAIRRALLPFNVRN